MKRDRFLIGILVFIGLLVVTSLVLFLIRRQGPAYVAEGTPEGVIHNYVVALQNRDYARAYSYVAEGSGMPAADEFRNVMAQQLNNSSTAIMITHTDLEMNRAVIDLNLIHQGSDPLSREWESSETALLVSQHGTWHITSMPYPYWSWNWVLK